VRACVCVCARACALNYCHQVATQLQLNISYHIISYSLVLRNLNIWILMYCLL